MQLLNIQFEFRGNLIWMIIQRPLITVTTNKDLGLFQVSQLPVLIVTNFTEEIQQVTVMMSKD